MPYEFGSSNIIFFWELKQSCLEFRGWVWSLGREDPWRRAWEHTPVFLPRESRGQRSLAGCGPSVQFSPVTQLCLTLCDPMNHSMPGLPVHHQLLESPKPMSIESVMPFNHLILCRPLLLLPWIFPSVRVFSNEAAFPIRWQSNGVVSIIMTTIICWISHLTKFRKNEWLISFIYKAVLTLNFERRDLKVTSYDVHFCMFVLMLLRVLSTFWARCFTY